MSIKCPLSALLMEFSEQLRHSGVRPNVRWTPREANCEADRLANRDTALFDPSLRLRVLPPVGVVLVGRCIGARCRSRGGEPALPSRVWMEATGQGQAEEIRGQASPEGPVVSCWTRVKKESRVIHGVHDMLSGC